MASQQPPPARPWFRLASIRPTPPAAAPTPTPQPDPVPPPRPVIRPAFSQTFRPPLAQPQEPTPSPPPVAAALPPPPPVTTPPPPTIVTPEPAPTRSPPPPARVSPPPPTIVTPEPAPPRSPPPPARVSPPTPPPPRVSPPPLASPAAPRRPATTTTTSSVPTSPIIRAAAPSSSLPTSPSLKQPTNGPLVSSTSPKPKLASPPPVAPPPPVPTTITTRSLNPSPTPKTITPRVNTPSPSPKTRHISHPPSPLTLPPAQLRSDISDPQHKIPQEPEQKTVLVQETIEKSKLTNSKSNSSQQKYVDPTRSPPIGQKGNREVAKDKGNYKNYSDSEDFGMRIITISGENKGAIMELSPSKKKNSPRVWSDGENSAKGYNDQKPPSSYVNSNVQGVNNSILFNASCTHHDPGVHFSLSRNGNGGRGIHMKERVIKD